MRLLLGGPTVYHCRSVMVAQRAARVVAFLFLINVKNSVLYHLPIIMKNLQKYDYGLYYPNFKMSF